MGSDAEAPSRINSIPALYPSNFNKVAIKTFEQAIVKRCRRPHKQHRERSRA